MRLLLALIISLVGAAAQAQEIARACESRYIFTHAAATGPVVVVPGTGQARIHFCGYAIVQKGQALNFQVIAGKGATCQTGTILLTPLIETPSDFQMTTRIPSIPPQQGTEGMSICLQTTGTGRLSGILFYSIF
jgi:hypothetical protein